MSTSVKRIEARALKAMMDAGEDIASGDRESMMRAYLAWEIDLVNQMATDDDQRFQVSTT